MSAPQFTPGPWFPHEPLGSKRKCGVTAVAPYDQSRGAVRRIAWLGSAGPCRSDALDAEDMANARLIAAAPELYEALEAMLDQTEELCFANSDAHAAYQQAEKALAKACGEQVSA